MRRKISRILGAIGVFFCLWIVWFAIDLSMGVSALVGKLVPASDPYLLYALLLLLGGAALWVTFSIVFKPGAIIVPDDPTEADLAALRKRLVRRLKRNQLVKREGFDLDTPEGMEAALAALRRESHEDIKSTARFVFLSTAVSRNGKLDSIAVMISLLRLVWRLTKIYGTRPSFREIYYIYMNVAWTAAFAFAIEDFDLTDQVGAIVGNTVSAIPGAPPITALITAAIMDGSINAYLVIRVGVLTQKYLSLDVKPHQKISKSTSFTAVKMLTEVSSTAAVPVAKMLMRISHSAAKTSAKKAVDIAATTARKTGSMVTRPWSNLFRKRPKDA
jgi:uncharacterized protein DUF697